MNRRFGQRLAKRLLDVCLAGGLLAAACPLLAAVWLVVRWKMGRPAMFCQSRPGKNANPFRLVKFRTMSDAPRRRYIAIGRRTIDAAGALAARRQPR